MRFAPHWKRFISVLTIVGGICGALGAVGCRRSASTTAVPAVSNAKSDSGDEGVAPDALLDSAIELLQSNQRSSEVHHVAAQRLNQYLLKSRAAGQTLLEPLTADTERTLADVLTQEQLQQIKGEQFDRPDARHLEACFLRRDAVKRATAGIRDDMDRVHALFDWVVRNVHVVGAKDAPPIPLTPAVTLILGRGTEEERAWVFVELLRQLEIDSVMLAYTEKGDAPNKVNVVPMMPAVLLDDSLHLFDTTIGLPVPGSDGKGVATLKQVQANPGLLSQLDLDSEHPYRFRPEHFKNVVVLLESTPDYWSPRMRFLQERLSGENRVILWSDFSSVYARFRQVMSEKTDFDLWPLPNTVDKLSRTQAYTEQLMGNRERMIGLLTPYQFFAGIDARVAHLHGRWKDAIPVYMGNRVSILEWATMKRNQVGLESIVMNVSTSEKDVEGARKELAAQVPDLYGQIREDSTYFLGVAKFEQHEYEPAANWLGKSYLERYGEGRWKAGALYHLGRCAEAQKDIEKAIEYYTTERTSPQSHGNLLRARRIGWKPGPPATAPADSPAAPANTGTSAP